MKTIRALAYLFSNAFGKKPDVLREGVLQRQHDALIRQACKRLARGNVSLKNGKFMTTQELEFRRKDNLSYKFD